MKAQLATIVDDDDGTPRHFAAGASGGGHGDQGRDLIGDARRTAFDGGVGFQRTRVVHRDGHTFGAIDGRATAHGNQAITALVAVHRHGRTHRGLRGVGGRLVKHRNRQVFQHVQRLL